jgi:hypothetical protein
MSGWLKHLVALTQGVLCGEGTKGLEHCPVRTFYFNVRRGLVVYEDHQGAELSGLGEAWDWALQDGQSLIEEGVVEGDLRECSIEILDERRHQVGTVSLAQLIKD